MQTVQSYDISQVDRGEVLRYLGYAGQPLTSELDARIDAGIRRCLSVSRPRGCVRVFDVGAWGERGGMPTITLEGTVLELRGNSIAAHLAGAVAVGALVVTAGIGVDAELRRLSVTDPVGQLVVDAAGSALVERAADAAQAQIVAEAASRGLFCGTRFSPGYGDLPLSTQATLLPALDAQRSLKVTLSSDLLMSPTKSVSAVVGLFGQPPSDVPGSCSGCPCRDFCVLLRSGRPCYGARC